MDARDRRLGMDRSISRRDFLNGVSLAVGASLLPACSRSGDSVAVMPETYYPPAQTGMRGAHPGSFEAAHAAMQGRRWAVDQASEHYDLIVVGAGISGLSAAHIYRRDVDPNARILILDNHDDFGGHAKRNEFTIDGRTLLGLGGTFSIVAPATYPEVASQVLEDLGIEAQRAPEFYHDDLYSSLGLARSHFFDRETFAADFLVRGDLADSPDLDEAPLPDAVKDELKRLFTDEKDYLAGMTPAERRTVLESHSWREYLQKYAGMSDESLTYIQKQPHAVWAIGADEFPAWLAREEGYPGFADMDLGYDGESNNTNSGVASFQFPDGNASVARMLVRRLVPGVAPGETMEDIVMARFDYSQLDHPDNPTRIRLSSTVVEMKHKDGNLDGEVDVTYVHDNKGQKVTAGKVIWAGYHSMLPKICPDIPHQQAASQSRSVRAPLLYTNVLVRNWQSFAKLGISYVYCPGSFFVNLRPVRPISIGEYKFPTSPDEPMVVHMQHIPLKPGLPAAEQFREGQRSLLGMPFETFERNVREQLDRILGPGGFDPARDIAAITVNRWPHGYAFSVDAETEEVAWMPSRWQDRNRPWEEARQRVGNIAFAGTDASSNAMTESAIEEAHRAVGSLVTKGA